MSELFAYQTFILGRGKEHGNISVAFRDLFKKMVFGFWIYNRRAEPNPNTTCGELDIHVARKSV